MAACSSSGTCASISTRTGLPADIEVIASAFGADRYRKLLAEWEGYHLNTTHMTNGAGDIFPGAPGDCGASELARADEVVDDFIAPTFVPASASFEEVARRARDAQGATDRRMHAYARLGQRDMAPLDELAADFDAEEGILHKTVGYALGNAAARMRPHAPDAVDGLAADLEGRIAGADEGERILLLQILGNIGAERSADPIMGALESESASVRAAAVTALRFIPGELVDAQLRDTMLR